MQECPATSFESLGSSNLTAKLCIRKLFRLCMIRVIQTGWWKVYPGPIQTAFKLSKEAAQCIDEDALLKTLSLSLLRALIEEFEFGRRLLKFKLKFCIFHFKEALSKRRCVNAFFGRFQSIRSVAL